MPRKLASLARLACLSVVVTTLMGCHPVPVPSGATPPTIRRETSFVPAPKVEGSRLATDRAVKMTAEDEEAMSALGGMKLGVLNVYVVDRVDAMTGNWNETVVWPGASIDAAALGATHARTISVEVPQPSPADCRRRRSPRCESPSMAKPVRAKYELWHVAPERWAELPEGLRPNALPASAIRDVQPGNWVRPPTVVDIESE